MKRNWLRAVVALAFVAATAMPMVASADGGGGCNEWGCWSDGGGCNQWGCSDHGGCNQWGCWSSPSGSCNEWGCTNDGQCSQWGCP